MTTETQSWTAEAFMRDAPDVPSELVDGRIVLLANASNEHGAIQINFGYEFTTFLRSRQLGRAISEMAVVTRRNPDTVRIPDVGVLSFARWPGSLRGVVLTVCPEIAVEIVSPDNTRAELARKTAEYLEAGAEQVWIADPRTRTITLHRASGVVTELAEDDMLIGEGLLDGFAVLVRSFFVE